MNQFLEASGASGPLLLGVGTPGVADYETRAFDLPFVLVGRDPRSDLQLDNPEVSERHAYFQMVNGQVVCIDLGSRNGVYYSGRCRRSSHLERDQAVRIGPYRIRLLAGDVLQTGVDLAPEDEPAPVLELSHRLVRQSRAALPRGLSLVGSGADCGIRLIDPSVSNYHCSLVRTPHGVWVVDLLGAGGLRVNGQEVGYARLYEGDAIEVGHSILRLSAQLVSPREASSRPEADVTDVEGQLPAVPRATPVVLMPRALEPERTARGDALQVAHAAELVDRIVAPLVQQFGMLQQQMVDEMNQARAQMFDTFATMHQEQSSFLNHELEQLRQLSQELQTLRADLERQTGRLMEQAPRRLGASSPPALANGAHPRTATPAPESYPVRAPAPRTTPEATAKAADQIHSLLCDRIAHLHQEQQTRWQKILSLLPGATAPKTTL